MNTLLVVGLGNPGSRYAPTRHNLGATVVGTWAPPDSVAEWRHDKGLQSEVADNRLLVKAAFERVLLLRPLTSMNHSGEAVLRALQKFSLASTDICVVHDDLELPLGTMRVKQFGSAAGHNGVRSIQQALSSDQFLRLRLGIGRPADERTVHNFVLAPFTPEEKEAVQMLIADAHAWLTRLVRERS